MTPARDLSAALSFLTVVGRGHSPTPGAVGWFPVVGALVGGAVGLVWWGANELWNPLVAALLAIGADLVITGALHHDGLADSADGLLPHMDRERRLEVMRTPDVGTFAVVVLGLVMLLRVGSLASIEPLPLVVAGVWCLSRSAMAVVMRTLPYARKQGLASPLADGPVLPVAVVGVVLGGVLMVPAGWPAVAAAGSLVAVSAGVAGLARRRIGGFTGDVLGAVCVLGETAAVLTLAANW